MNTALHQELRSASLRSRPERFRNIVQILTGGTIVLCSWTMMNTWLANGEIFLMFVRIADVHILRILFDFRQTLFCSIRLCRYGFCLPLRQLPNHTVSYLRRKLILIFIIGIQLERLRRKLLRDVSVASVISLVFGHYWHVKVKFWFIRRNCVFLALK